jgi:hypothetical protein
MNILDRELKPWLHGAILRAVGFLCPLDHDRIP